jgi:hypothetical protein
MAQVVKIPTHMTVGGTSLIDDRNERALLAAFVAVWARAVLFALV